MEFKRVVVTGLGALTPIGNSVDEYWKALAEGQSGAAGITHFDCSKFKTRFACEVKNFNGEDFFERKELKRYDPFTQYAIVSADQAVADSGIAGEGVDTDEVGVIWASGIGGLNIFQEQMRDFYLGDGTPRFNPFFIPKMIIDIASGHISMKYGMRGPNYATVSACASSTNAMIDAFTYIRLGRANAIVTGGSEAPITIGGVGGFSAMKALSERNDEPATASRPFDKTRDGFVVGEGAGALVLEELEHAKARGAKIYCEVVGGGMSGDAYHMTAPHPEGLGATLVMNRALKDGGISADQIDYVNVHGTSTPLGDLAELKAITNVFGDHAYKLNVSSTKSMTGHLLGAAGAIETLACIMAVRDDIIPPTINVTDRDDEIDPRINLTLNKAEKREVKYALSNTFGFGGHNASIIVKKFED